MIVTGTLDTTMTREQGEGRTSRFYEYHVTTTWQRHTITDVSWVTTVSGMGETMEKMVDFRRFASLSGSGTSFREMSKAHHEVVTLLLA